MSEPVSDSEKRRSPSLFGRLLNALARILGFRRQTSGAMSLPPPTGVPAPAGSAQPDDGPRILNLAADPAEAAPTPNAETIVVRKRSKTRIKLPGVEIHTEDDDTALADPDSRVRLDLLGYCRWAVIAFPVVGLTARAAGASTMLSLIIACGSGAAVLLVGTLTTLIRVWRRRHRG
jgi:hypothetical protein